MKISVLTPTYNRGTLLKRLYNSLVKNENYEIEIEWLIMDDGSTDDSKQIIESFEKNTIDIKYYKQKNQGKMIALNKLMKYATGELIIECDSDDYFTDDAFQIIKKAYDENKKNQDIAYGLCFLKYDTKGTNIGKTFNKKITTMFDLYFKDGENGEKAIVFYSNIRKQYKHQLENNERFITEARLYHKMDQKYKIICINKPIMICEYQNDGYTNNIKKQFIENPYGYYQYFKEIFEQNMKNVIFSKRIYVIKHFILFTYLTKKRKSIKNVKGIHNKILYILLYIPGIVKSKIKFNNN